MSDLDYYSSIEGYNNLNHSIENVERLWLILKDIKCGDGHIKKIIPTYFDTKELDEFTQRYHHAIKMKAKAKNMNIESFVKTDIEEALPFLHNENITSHHLSCQTSRTTNHNSAILIYLQNQKKYLAIAIPGLNYVFDRRDIDSNCKLV
jgi:hypothetical protein